MLPCPRMPIAAMELSGSLHSGPCRSSPCQCFLPGRTSLSGFRGGNCFPKSFLAGSTWKTWRVLVIGNDGGTACRGESPALGKKGLHPANTSRLGHLQGRWWFFKLLFAALQVNKLANPTSLWPHRPQHFAASSPPSILMLVQSCSPSMTCLGLADNWVL